MKMLNIKVWMLMIICVVLLSNYVMADLGISLKEMSPATVAQAMNFLSLFRFLIRPVLMLRPVSS